MPEGTLLGYRPTGDDHVSLLIEESVGPSTTALVCMTAAWGRAPGLPLGARVLYGLDALSRYAPDVGDLGTVVVECVGGFRIALARLGDLQFARTSATWPEYNETLS